MLIVVGVLCRVNHRGTSKTPLSDYWKVVKRQWGLEKTRYRGLAKNTARLYTAFDLANLYRARKRLLPPGATCAL